LERSINKAVRDIVILLFLASAFFALLWAPFEWISSMYSNQEHIRTVSREVAGKFEELWPLLVGGTLAGAFFSFRAKTWGLGILVPTIVVLCLIVRRHINWNT